MRGRGVNGVEGSAIGRIGGFIDITERATLEWRFDLLD
jgi:hypothetical protein